MSEENKTKCDCGCEEVSEEKEIENTCDCDENCNYGCEESCDCTDEDCDCGEDCDCIEKCDCGCEDIDSNEEKIKELEEKILRDKAEMINYRKRKDDEVSRLLKFSNEDIIKELLPVVDNFERAINMDNENLEDEVSKFLSGFKMIYCNLASTLEKYDVKVIDGKNKPFDPTYHQAVMTEKVEKVESGIVIDVLQKGYILKDKVIRPAMVKVSE